MKKTLIIFLFIISTKTFVGQATRVAILDFDNISGIAKYDGLGKAMSSMLISDIESNVSPKRLQLVERAQIKKILKEQNFQSSGSVNKNTAVKVGKILGVSYLLVGDVYILNDQLIINARLTNTETGDIVFSKKQEGKIIGWLTLKTNIAKDLASNLSQPFTKPTMPDKEMNFATISTFANAVSAKDTGDVKKAEELINTVQEFSPDFKYLDDLKSQLEEIKKSLEQIQKTSDLINKKQDIVLTEINKLQSVNEELLKSINPKKIILSNDLKIKINTQLSDKDYKKYSNLITEPFSTFENLELMKYGDEIYVNNKNKIRNEVAIKYPNTDIGYFCRAYFEELKGNYIEANALNDSASAVNPVFWLAYWKNGKLLNDIEYFNKAVKANPEQSIVAREDRGLYFMLTTDGPNEVLHLNLAKKDFQECFRLTGNIYYKFLECCLYYDHKIWSDLCPLMNSTNIKLYKNLRLFKDNNKLYTPMFAICDQDTSVFKYEDILSNKAKYNDELVIIHFTLGGISEYGSLYMKDEYYLPIKGYVKPYKVYDYERISPIQIDLFMNRHIFKKEIEQIENIEKGELYTAIIHIKSDNIHIINIILAIEKGYKLFSELTFDQKPIYKVQKNGIIEYSEVGQKIINCFNQSTNNFNEMIKCIEETGGFDKFYKLFSDYPILLNNLAWAIASKSLDKSEIQWALKMIERANYIEFEKNHNYLDTYSYILFKNGSKKESKEKLEKAIELAKNKNDEESVKKYQKRLSEF
jgi:TolB-like protein